LVVARVREEKKRCDGDRIISLLMCLDTGTRKGRIENNLSYLFPACKGKRKEKYEFYLCALAYEKKLRVFQ